MFRPNSADPCSSGTLLGATFAALFPDSVGRLILDGVVDAEVYERPAYIDSMVDADPIFGKFFYYCHLAQEECALYRKGDTVNDLETRFNEVMAKLDKEPAIIVGDHASLPLSLTTSDVKLVIFQSLYSPVKLFPVLAIVLDLIYRDKDLTPLLSRPDLGFACLPNQNLRLYPDDSSFATSCSDRQYKVRSLLVLQSRFSEVDDIRWTRALLVCRRPLRRWRSGQRLQMW